MTFKKKTFPAFLVLIYDKIIAWKNRMNKNVFNRVIWLIKTTQQINGSLKPRPAGTIFVSNVAMIKTRPSSIAIRNEIFSPDFTGIKIAIIDTQPSIRIGSTIVNVVCLYFRCGINETVCWPKTSNDQFCWYQNRKIQFLTYLNWLVCHHNPDNYDRDSGNMHIWCLPSF